MFCSSVLDDLLVDLQSKFGLSETDLQVRAEISKEIEKILNIEGDFFILWNAAALCWLACL